MSYNLEWGTSHEGIEAAAVGIKHCFFFLLLVSYQYAYHPRAGMEWPKHACLSARPTWPELACHWNFCALSALFFSSQCDFLPLDSLSFVLPPSVYSSSLHLHIVTSKHRLSRVSCLLPPLSTLYLRCSTTNLSFTSATFLRRRARGRVALSLSVVAPLLQHLTTSSRAVWTSMSFAPPVHRET
jgi:hypothetical protein